MRSRLPYRQPTGLYVHSSPPTGVPVHDSVVRQWLRGGEIARLRELVLEGEGTALVGEYSPDVTARSFLRSLPRILSRIDEAHEAAAAGDIDRVEQTIKRERAAKIELSKDHSGLTILHKAVIHGHHKLQDWLLENYPDLVHLVDRERRSALHYAGSSPDGEVVWKRLTSAGADPALVDSSGKSPAFYMMHPRRARPPQPRGTAVKPDRGLVVKPANIRIWIHDRDLGRLQKVVWEGHGQKLLKETSSQPKVRRFLNAVPYILGLIRDVHKAAIENDVETIKARTEDPVPRDLLLSKDANGLNPLHKAAGMGNKEAMMEILKRAPEAANAQDSFGRTPLHYAAGLRDQEMYQALVESGATDHLLDKRGSTPSYYRSKPSDLDGTRLLSVVPEAPRTAHIFPPSWDWGLLQSAETQYRPQESAETVMQDSTTEDTTDTTQETEEISRDEAVEESRPEVSEDEGVGSENAQSVDDAASPQNDENIDIEDEGPNKLGQTITLSNPVFLGGLQVEPDEGGIAQTEEGTQLDSSDSKELEEYKQKEDEVRSQDHSKEQGEPSNIPDETETRVEPVLERAQTATIRQGNIVENTNNSNTESSLEDISSETTARPLNNNEEKRDGNSSLVRSGRQSLKSRVKKMMWLGKFQGSLRGSNQRDQIEQDMIEPTKGFPDSLPTETSQTFLQSNEEDSNTNRENADQSVVTESSGSTEQNVNKLEENTSENINSTPLVDQEVTPLSELTEDNRSKHADQEQSQHPQDSIENLEPKAEEPPTAENEEVTPEEAKKSAEEDTVVNSYEDEMLESANEQNGTRVESEEGEENNKESTETSSKSNISGARRAEAERLVAAGDMEAMAEMVLAGEGEVLLDLTSDNPDVQLFINNVPQYMAKIERVHKSSREGDLRGVRTSLDRRKYAVSRDNSTSLKPTPLHVAVLFGRTSVLRYLAGRFPETMHAQDSGGRTPLHYAATLPDNGHFYSLLITLGADKAIVDDAGKTADYYLKNKDELTREMLLAEYQDRPVPIDTSGLNFNRYSDKVENDTVSARHDVDEEALLEQMERCFKLLSTRAPGSALGRILNKDLFEELQLLYTKLDNTLLDIIRPMGKDLALGKNRILTDPNFTGITIPDQESFTLFGNLIEPLIKEINGITEFNNEPSDYFGGEDQNFFTIDLDPGGIIVKSCIVEVVRNLLPLSFVKNLKLSELEKVEVALSTVLTRYYRKNKDAAFVDEAGENHGSYYSLGEIFENKEVLQDLKDEGLVINGVDESDWPYGRGVFISPYGDITAWVNIREHIQLLSVTPADKRGQIGTAYKAVFEIIQSLEEKVECTRDPKLGLLATEPGFVGNCLRIHVLLSLPHIGGDLPSLKKLCSSRNLLVEENSGPGIFRLRNRPCQNINEINLFKLFISSITDIIEMEKASMRVTVAQIPNLIKNFLRKKSSKEKLK